MSNIQEKQVQRQKRISEQRGSRISSEFYQPPSDTQADGHHHQERSANIHHELPRRDILHLHFFRMSVRRAIGDTVAEVLGTLLLGQLCVALLLRLHDACAWVGGVKRLLARLVVVVYEGWVVVFTPLLDLRGKPSVRRISRASQGYTNLAACDRNTNKVGVRRVCFVMDPSRVFAENQANLSWVCRTHDELANKINKINLSFPIAEEKKTNAPLQLPLS